MFWLLGEFRQAGSIQSAIKFKQFFECAQNDLRASAGLLAGSARIVVHTDFLESEIFLSQLGQQLDCHHGTTGFEFNPFENGSLKHFEGAIQVTHTDPEQDADQHTPAFGKYLSMKGVAAVDAVPENCIIRVDLGQKKCDFTNIELAIPIGKKDQVSGGIPKAGAHRSAIPLVDFVMDGAQAWNLLNQVVQQFTCSIGAAIIDDQDLIIRDNAGQDIVGLFDQLPDILDFIVCGKKRGQAFHDWKKIIPQTASHC